MDPGGTAWGDDPGGRSGGTILGGRSGGDGPEETVFAYGYIRRLSAKMLENTRKCAKMRENKRKCAKMQKYAKMSENERKCAKMRENRVQIFCPPPVGIRNRASDTPNLLILSKSNIFVHFRTFLRIFVHVYVFSRIFEHFRAFLRIFAESCLM